MPNDLRAVSSFRSQLARATALLLTTAWTTAWLCAPGLNAQEPAGQKLPDDRSAGAASVDVALCKQWLGTLAGPEFEGRGTGQPGYQKAADYVAAHFKSLGLEARGEDGSMFQHVPWSTTTVGRAEVIFRANGEAVLTVPADRLTGTVSTSTTASGPVVLLNVAAPAADGQADNGRRRQAPTIAGLDELDVTDKIVVCVVRGEGRNLAMTRFAVMQGLQGKNAAAVVYATGDEVRGGLRGRRGMSRRGGNPAAAAAGRRPLDVSFGGEDLSKLLARAGLAFDKLDEAPLSIPLDLTGEVAVEITSEQSPAMNVWAVLPGSDPKLQDEYVVIGSHLDHLGTRGEAIYPGADDDASGTTGVMAVAKMFAENPVRPRRSILFVCFSGEESGLIGSGYFVQNCPIPLSAITAELQMDMIGRDEEEAMDGGRRVNIGETAAENRNSLHLVGTEKLAPELHELCLARNELAGFDLEFDQESLFTRSDHANFARQGVPIAFFFTGLHMDYHQQSDTPDKIHYEKLLRVARYVYDLGFELANQDTRPAVDPELWQAFRGSNRRNTSPEQPAAPLLPDSGRGK